MKTKEQRLKPEILRLIRDDMTCRNRMAYELNLSHSTLNNYVRENDRYLTTADSLNIISEELEISIDELLTEIEIAE